MTYLLVDGVVLVISVHVSYCYWTDQTYWYMTEKMILVWLHFVTIRITRIIEPLYHYILFYFHVQPLYHYIWFYFNVEPLYHYILFYFHVNGTVNTINTLLWTFFTSIQVKRYSTKSG